MQSRRTRFLRLSLLALLCALLTACSVGGPAGSGTGRAVPPPDVQPGTAEPARLDAFGRPLAPRLREGPLSRTELGAAFRLIRDSYVEPIDQRHLLDAATNVLDQELRKEPLLPLFTLPVKLVPVNSTTPERDWSAFVAAYEAIVRQRPSWAENTRPDGLVLSSMLTALQDSHSMFLTPDDLRRRRETNYVGIGIRLARPEPNQPPLIAEIFANSPAAAAGIRSGDRILEADGRPLQGLPLSEVIQLVRGPRGSEIRLLLQRSGAPRPIEVRIVRAPVEIEQVSGRLVDAAPLPLAIGYLRIRSFAPDTGELVAAVLQGGTQAGAVGWIMDLRGNPGGELEGVRRTAGSFMDPSPIGYEVNRQGERTEILAEPSGLMMRRPLVVLVDQESASGAEILAAALRDHGVAPVVGTRTAGSVGVATLVTLADGSAIQVTNRRYETPNGIKLEGVGLTPDLAVDLQPSDLEAGNDPQLARAFELLLMQLRR